MTKNPLLLVAEDEVMLHLALEDELTASGYEVLFVTSGAKAIEQLKLNSEKFSALITD